jgi:ATP-dependent RNA helicase RhlE
VILVPTRELVVQVVGSGKINKIHVGSNSWYFGGVNINTQKTTVYQGCDILVGTPGRIMDLTLDNVIRFEEMQN